MPFFAILALALATVGAYSVSAWSPILVQDDPLVRMPGTQPDQVLLEGPGRCLNCHEGYDSQVEPGFNWMGSISHKAGSRGDLILPMGLP